MIAPRKLLWSTPDSAVDILIRWITLKDGDSVCDIGCGDGRVLLHWAMALSSQTEQPAPAVTFVGIEIDHGRSEFARTRIKEAYEKGEISQRIRIQIYTTNALTASQLFSDVTVFFLYLIPRGLRLMKPMLTDLVQQRQNNMPTKVVTYMSPLPDEDHVAKELCRVEHQPDAAWPIYLYHLNY
jgi:SAM-dependent methyltransferase